MGGGGGPEVRIDAAGHADGWSAKGQFFTVFFAFFPSGLVLYWTVNNLLSIAQQWYITRKVEQAAAHTATKKTR